MAGKVGYSYGDALDCKGLPDSFRTYDALAAWADEHGYEVEDEGEESEAIALRRPGGRRVSARYYETGFGTHDLHFVRTTK